MEHVKFCRKLCDYPLRTVCLALLKTATRPHGQSNLLVSFFLFLLNKRSDLFATLPYICFQLKNYYVLSNESLFL